MPTIVESLKAVVKEAQMQADYLKDDGQPWEFLADHVARVKDHIFTLENGSEYSPKATPITDEMIAKVGRLEKIMGKFSDHNVAYVMVKKWKTKGFKARSKKVGDNQYHLFVRTG